VLARHLGATDTSAYLSLKADRIDSVAERGRLELQSGATRPHGYQPLASPRRFTLRARDISRTPPRAVHFANMWLAQLGGFVFQCQSK
jgi:hypothetical protein